MAKYDAEKQYKWEPDTDFIMAGSEFGLILNTFRSILRTPEAQEVLLVAEANKTIEGILKRNVETGLVKEVPAPPAPGQEQLAPKSKTNKTKKPNRKPLTKA